MSKKINYSSPEFAFFKHPQAVNPVIFLNRIKNLILEDGLKMRDDKVRACLLLLNQLSYGQLATIDLTKEWTRLKDALIIEVKRQ